MLGALYLSTGYSFNSKTEGESSEKKIAVDTPERVADESSAEKNSDTEKTVPGSVRAEETPEIEIGHADEDIAFEEAVEIPDEPNCKWINTTRICTPLDQETGLPMDEDLAFY